MVSKPIFGRTASVLIGENEVDTVLIDGFRFNFTIRKTDSEDPNTCVLNVYNLSLGTRARMEKLDDFAFVKAGYTQADNIQTIFVGNITDSTTLYESPEIITQITISDGEKSINDKKVSVSYKGGATVSQVLEDIVKKIGLTVKTDIKSLGINKIFNTGFSFTGNAKTAVKKLSEFSGLDWSIQNNELKFTKEGKSDGSKIVFLSPETGLIKTPEKIKIKNNKRKKEKELDGWKITSLLQPQAEPGGLIEVNSVITKGSKTFKIIDVQHDGDTFEGNFQTVMQVVEVTT
mgnify:CR=1 FL=1